MANSSRTGLNSDLFAATSNLNNETKYKFMSGLAPEVAHAVCAAAERRSLARNDDLIREGEPADACYILQEGAATVRKSFRGGCEQVVGFLFSGDIMGTAHLRQYAYSVRMLSSTEVLRFDRRAFDDLCDTYPQFGSWLLQAACGELAAAQDHMLLLARKTARERIAQFLLHLDARFEKRAVWMPMRRREIADYLGVSLETVSRIMAEFTRNGYIQTDGRYTLYILNRSELSTLAEGAGH